MREPPGEEGDDGPLGQLRGLEDDAGDDGEPTAGAVELHPDVRDQDGGAGGQGDGEEPEDGVFEGDAGGAQEVVVVDVTDDEEGKDGDGGVKEVLGAGGVPAPG